MADGQMVEAWGYGATEDLAKKSAQDFRAQWLAEQQGIT